MKIKLYENTNEIKIRRGVRQGFIIKLFDVFVNLNWQTKGLNISGERFNNLKFVADSVICSEEYVWDRRRTVN